MTWHDCKNELNTTSLSLSLSIPTISHEEVYMQSGRWVTFFGKIIQTNKIKTIQNWGWKWKWNEIEKVNKWDRIHKKEKNGRLVEKKKEWK
jgi:hypothetical protein